MSQQPQAEPGFWTRTSLIQLGYGVWVNLTMVVIGLGFGFTAVALPQLSDAKSNIHLTVSDRSWITSVLTLLSPVGCVITGYLADKFGRRITLIFCHLPAVIGWFYTAIAATAMDLIIGRMITGLGLGMIVVAPRPYLSEIALPKMRGVIGTFPNLALSIGVVIQAGLGAFCTWRTLCYFCTIYSLVLMISNYFLPETPHFLLMTDTLESAEASLRKFRSADYNIEMEMEELRIFKTVNNIYELTWRDTISALFTGPSCKPFFIIFIYFMFTQTSGISVMTMWTVEILRHSKSSLDEHTGNILLGITRFVSGVFTSVIIFRVGRRPLALSSCLGVGISNVAVGPYIIYTKEPTVFPQICYMTHIMFASLGYYSLPVLIMSELYPLQVRGILGGVSTSINYFLIFAVNKLYPYMVVTIGFANTIVTFGVFSLFGCIFLYFFLPETKGFTLHEIEQYFSSRRSTLLSQREIISTTRLSSANMQRRENSKNIATQREENKNRNESILEGQKDTKDGGPSSHTVPKNK